MVVVDVFNHCMWCYVYEFVDSTYVLFEGVYEPCTFLVCVFLVLDAWVDYDICLCVTPMWHGVRKIIWNFDRF